MGERGLQVRKASRLGEEASVEGHYQPPRNLGEVPTPAFLQMGCSSAGSVSSGVLPWSLQGPCPHPQAPSSQVTFGELWPWGGRA